MATTYEQRDGTGSLFRNEDKESDNHPDYKGSCTIDGKKMYISAWIKESKEGMKYMSLSIQPPLKSSALTKPRKPERDDEQIPF